MYKAIGVRYNSTQMVVCSYLVYILVRKGCVMYYDVHHIGFVYVVSWISGCAVYSNMLNIVVCVHLLICIKDIVQYIA